MAKNVKKKNVLGIRPSVSLYLVSAKNLFQCIPTFTVALDTNSLFHGSTSGIS